MGFLDYCVQSTAEYINEMPKKLRKTYGQFFTSKETAAFMASLFSPPKKNSLRILDPGTGSGILTAAILDQLEQSEIVDSIEVTCYETDPNIISLLRSNLLWIAQHSKKIIKYIIIEDNYIVSQTEDYNYMIGMNRYPKKYDMIIGNPPYMKVGKSALEAQAMPDICFGAPNTYFLFSAMSLFNLEDQSEMVYIIPRSWTSGAYFKEFRRKFLTDGALQHIHLFISRDKVFTQESVLQETIIIKVAKTKDTPKEITITTSKSNADFSDITVFVAPYNVVVNGPDYYVYLVTCKEDIEVLETLNQWKNTLLDLGMKMKTGLTVDFRHQSMLRCEPTSDTVPLFYSFNIQNGRVVFPTKKGLEYIVPEKAGLVQKNTNYLFVKRFTSKEEHRRLQCGIYLAEDFPNYKKISTQNKINFIAGESDLSKEMTYGLYVLFNSKLYDEYYRILNGSTQVNSTEINSMPVPPANIIIHMGKTLIESSDLSEEICDSIMRCYYE